MQWDPQIGDLVLGHSGENGILRETWESPGILIGTNDKGSLLIARPTKSDPRVYFVHNYAFTSTLQWEVTHG